MNRLKNAPIIKQDSGKYISGQKLFSDHHLVTAVTVHFKGQHYPVSPGCVRKRQRDLEKFLHPFSKNCVMRNIMGLGDIRIATTK